ncbi:ribulose-5-phosphate 4-epimerase/fuculose-1-phosphate aldolase [Phyllobacterium trifolii]|uniref:Ribulose-5-phosphate 4-epimerase/fuculose-1-phosphate aldolase n=1 Tax=Phyllobacterium trifolii TaxID=300193 RepID=A0A839UKA3_9HYPH|nr:class II aldolase/adducin family protein [Phyllobacterium trifolii]MBB3149162.1 ribulose-5-phosphate 4-epimerase/fuculose-1-phosphate aldolase [Phyllobacterium trifolii]
MKPVNSPDTEERQLRIDLAAAFRLAADFNWHESVGNHFSVTISPGSRKFLMNPRWMHFSRISANDLLLLDADDNIVMEGSSPPDPSAWAIHSRLHARLPHVRCLLHLHPPYSTALASLADPELKPIDQNTARFYNRIAIDTSYGGIADDREEGERLADVLGNGSIMLMGNHGVLVAGESIAQAFDDLYFLERAAQTMILAYSTGQPLNIMVPELAERTARDWENYKGMPVAHLEELKLILDGRDPSYAM